MKRIIWILGCVLTFLLPPSVAFATHIVGGIITYRFVSRNGSIATYEFELTMYKDCSTINSSGGNSPLPSSVNLATYVGSSTARMTTGVNTATLINATVERVAPPNYPCLTIPPYVCVDQGVYRWTMQLRDTVASYYVVANACCRNERISNIFSNPNTTGASYIIEITKEGQRANNSSPRFNLFPPTVICVGEPLSFDHSANDVDGDSLTYEFCYSNDRASTVSNCVGTSIPCPPPLVSVQYRSPQYSGTNPMGGSPRIIINRNTGLITGTPTIQGNYVVGVCVKEYRNGVYMGSIFRDFQFNAEICRRNLTAAVVGDSISDRRFFLKSCDDLTLNIANISSQRANIFSTLWRFYIRDSIRELNTWDANITFPDTGTYRARLLLNPNTVCGDSAEIEVRVGPYSLNPQFTFQYDTCVAGPVTFTNQTVRNTEYPFVKYKWDLGNNQQDSLTWSPVHQYAAPGAKIVNLTLWDRIGCQRTKTVNFNWVPAPPIILVEPSNYKGCVPGRIFFKNRSFPVDSTYRVLWNFGDGNTLNSVDATHVYERTGIYTISLLVTSPIGCQKSAVFQDLIAVYPKPTADFTFSPTQPTNLLPTVNFYDSSSADVVARRWFFGGTYGTSIEQNPQVIYGRDTGWIYPKLLVNNQYGCADTITKKIYIKPEVTFFMPTAFTPNHDAVNEEFKGVGFTYGLKSFRMVIWSRWGEIVFETTNVNDGWNGTKFNNGELLPQGVYVYEINFTSPTGEKVQKKDYFTLFR